MAPVLDDRIWDVAEALAGAATSCSIYRDLGRSEIAMENLLLRGDRFLNYHVCVFLLIEHPARTVSRVMGAAVSNAWYLQRAEEEFPELSGVPNAGECWELAAGMMEAAGLPSSSTLCELMVERLLATFEVELNAAKDTAFANMLEAKKADQLARTDHTNHKGRCLETFQKGDPHTPVRYESNYEEVMPPSGIMFFRCCTQLFAGGGRYVGRGSSVSKKEAEQFAFREIMIKYPLGLASARFKWDSLDQDE